MENNDKLYQCADSYAGLSNYEYKICLYNNGTIINTTIGFDDSGFMHLAGLEKLSDLTQFSDTSSSRLYNNIMNHSVTYQVACSSSSWNNPLNDPKKNGVTYTLDDRIKSLTEFRNLLSKNLVKAYSWDSNCHSSARPYNSEICADFMLVFEPENKKTPDERIYAFFKLDKHNPEVAHGVSQFPTDRTYNNDGKRNVHEITIMSLIEHDRVNNVDRTITELPIEEQKRLIDEVEQHSVNSVVAKDLRQLKSKRYKYFKSKTEATRKAYERKLEIFGNRSPYTNEMLKEAADRLMAQSKDLHNNDVKDLIIKEVDLIKAEIANREKNQNTESSGITIMQSVLNYNGTVTLIKPIVTIETPQAVIKAISQIEKGTQFADSSIRNFFTDVKDSFKKAVSKFHKTPTENSDKQVSDEKEDPHLSIKENPYYIKITSDKQLDKLQKSGIPFLRMKKKEGIDELVIAVSMKDAKAAKDCIKAVQKKHKL